jgi:hypothetical protein
VFLVGRPTLPPSAIGSGTEISDPKKLFINSCTFFSFSSALAPCPNILVSDSTNLTAKVIAFPGVKSPVAIFLNHNIVLELQPAFDLHFHIF